MERGDVRPIFWFWSWDEIGARERFPLDGFAGNVRVA